jgi:hypothetical protein
MSMQGKLSIERMCRLAVVSRASFYRYLTALNMVIAAVSANGRCSIALRGSPSLLSWFNRKGMSIETVGEPR